MSEVILIGLLAKALGCFISHRVHSDFSLFLYMGKLKKGDKEYEKIKKSIVEFGYVDPIIVNFDGTVIGGHQRLTVLSDLGYKEVQCVQVRIDDENKVKALNVALNKITGAWNEELLADLMVDLQDADFNLDLTGFEAPEIDQLFSKVHNKEVKEDDFDVDGELTKPTISKQGDIFAIPISPF